MTGDTLTDFPEIAIRRELESICRAPTLARSPVMLRLLRYLVDQSLSGSGAALKSYSVAVEGLGRNSDFDAQSDSYPRVQAGRLRRLLELHYHRLGDDDRPIRLRIAPVGYAVVIADTPPHIDRPPATATDDTDGLWQPIADAPRALEAPSAGGTTTAPAALMPAVGHAPATMTGWPWHRYLAVAAMIFIALAASIMIYFDMSDRPIDSQRPPTLRLVVRGSVDDSQKDEVRGWLMDSLHPSWVYRLTDNATQLPVQDGSRPLVSHYQLVVNIVPHVDGRTMQLILTNDADEQISWTQIVRVGPAGDPLSPLEPSIAALSSPSGVIATAELARYGPSKVGAHGCALLAERYLRLFAAQTRAQLSECVARGLRANPDDAKLLVSRALMQYNRVDPLSDLSDASRRRSYADVQRAAQIAPFDPSVALIQSRYLFLRGDCSRGAVRAQQAIDAWPLLARSWGLTGFFLFDCGDPRAVAYVNRARHLQGASTSLYESVRVFDALERNDLVTANQIAGQLNPEDRAADIYQQLTDTVLAAANNRSDEAWRRWVAFAAGANVAPSMPDAVMRHYAIGARYRRITSRFIEPIVAARAAQGT